MLIPEDFMVAGEHRSFAKMAVSILDVGGDSALVQRLI